MFDKAVSNNSLMMKYYLDRNKTQKIYAIKLLMVFYQHEILFLIGLLQVRTLEKLYNDLFAEGDVLFFDDDSGNVTFFGVEISILSVDLNNINLDDVNFDKDDPETIIHVRLMTWGNKFKP